jgi:hypothetical protein
VLRTWQVIYKSNRALDNLEDLVSIANPVSIEFLHRATCDTYFLGSYSKSSGMSGKSSPTCGTSMLQITSKLYTDISAQHFCF